MPLPWPCSDNRYIAFEFPDYVIHYWPFSPRSASYHDQKLPASLHSSFPQHSKHARNMHPTPLKKGMDWVLVQPQYRPQLAPYTQAPNGVHSIFINRYHQINTYWSGGTNFCDIDKEISSNCKIKLCSLQ